MVCRAANPNAAVGRENNSVHATYSPPPSEFSGSQRKKNLKEMVLSQRVEHCS